MARSLGTDRGWSWGGGVLTFAGEEIGQITNASLSVDYETIRLKAGTSLDPFATETVGRTITGTAEYATISPAGMAGLYGQTLNASGVVLAQDEQFTMDAAAGNTLTNVPVLTNPQSTIVYYADTTNNLRQYYKRVTSGPADGEFTISSAGALGWNASDTNDAATSMYATYHYWTNDAVNISWGATTEPAEVGMVLSRTFRNWATKNKKSQTLVAKSVKITSWNPTVSLDGFAFDNINFELSLDSSNVILDFHSSEG